MENQNFIEEFKKYVADPKSRVVLLAGTAIFSLVAIGTVLIIIKNNSASQEIAEAKKIENNPDQKALILTEIVKNNPKTSVVPNVAENIPSVQSNNPNSSNQDKFVGNSGYVQVDPSTGLPSSVSTNPVGIGAGEQPDLRKYNYRKTVQTEDPGPLSGVCGTYYVPSEKVQFTTSEFFDSQNSYYKRDTTYSDGSTGGYYISHYGVNVNQTYNYAGGKYAVRTVYKPSWYSNNSDSRTITSYPTTSYPSSYPSINQIVQNLYGYAAVVQRVFQQGTKTYYEIRTEYSDYCKDDANTTIAKYKDPNGNVTAINVTTVDAETFEITNIRTYFGDQLPANLVYNIDLTNNYQLTTFDNVSSEFKETFISNIKTVDWSNYTYSTQEYINRVSNYMKDNAMELLIPSDEINFNYLYAINTPPAIKYADFSTDRDYYPEGARGDKLFASATNYKNYYPTLDYSLVTNNGYYYLGFDQYGSSYDYQSHLSDFKADNANSTFFEKTIKIDGQDVNILVKQTVYDYPYYQTSYPVSFVEDLASKYPTISSLSYPTSYPASQYFYVYYNVYFEFNGRVYRGYFPGWAINRFFNTNYTNLKVGEQEGYIKFVDLLNNSLM